MDKLMVPELKCWIFNQLNEGNEEAPGVRPVYNQSFQENSIKHKEKQVKARKKGGREKTPQSPI